MDLAIEILLMIIYTIVTVGIIMTVDYVLKFLSQKKKVKSLIHHSKI